MAKVWIIDKQRSFRNGMKILLEKENPKWKVDAFGLMPNLKANDLPQLVIIDPLLQDNFNYQVNELKNKRIPFAILAMEQNKSELLRLLKYRANGYLMKDMNTTLLIEAIERLISKKLFVHPSFGGVLLEYSTYGSEKDIKINP